MIAGAAAVALLDPVKAGFFPVCPLLKLTGFACPGCGLTRAFHALAHGDVIGALDLNALTPVFGALALFFLVSLVLTAVRGRGLKMETLRPGLMWAMLIAMVVFGVVRNIPAYPFSVLFP